MSHRSEKPANRGKAASARPDVIAAQVHPGSGAAWPFWRRDCFAGLLLVFAALAVYLRVWHAGFIWDDEMHLTNNPAIVGPLGLWDIWTSRAARICPLVLTTFWVEHAAWGLNPLPYHVVNVLMHGACAVALWRALQGLRVRGAWMGAALWALHPVQVETVAWVTELKNTQSCLFYLLAILFFVKWTGAGAAGRRARDYALALLFAALAMASKSSTVVLPLVLGLCAWWTEGRLAWRTWARLVPVFLMSAAASALAIWTQHLEGANEAEWARGWPERIAVSGRIFWFYLGKLLWPHPLVFIYPRWRIDGTQAASYVATAAMVAFLALLWWRRNGSLRPAFFSFAYFLVALLPVLGLVDQFFWRYSFVGDHFQYLASMGPLALAGAGIATALGCLGRNRLLIGPALCGALLSVLGVLSWRQCAVYRNLETLWRTTIAGNPECWIAYNNLGVALLDMGRRDEAVADFERAVEIRHDHVEAHYNLGNALLQMGRVDDAIAHFQKALEFDPGFEKAHNNLGNALLQEGRVDEAVAHFNRALEINPGLADAQNNLGNAFAQVGRMGDAAAHYREALKIDPGYAEAFANLGAVSLKGGRADEAVGFLRSALAINPNSVRAVVNLGNAFLQMGRPDDAAAQYQRAIEIDPNSAEAHNNLGFVYLSKGRIDEAIAQCRTALGINPNYPEAHRNLGTALFKAGKTDEADAQFQKALRPR